MRTGPALSFLRNQSHGFCRHCSRFTTQLLASLPLLPLLLFLTVESHTAMACPSMILIASGTVATSVGDEFWWLVMEMKAGSSFGLQCNGRNTFLTPCTEICLVSHPDRVFTVPECANSGVQKGGCWFTNEYVLHRSSCDNTCRVLFIFFPDTSHIQL